MKVFLAHSLPLSLLLTACGQTSVAIPQATKNILAEAEKSKRDAKAKSTRDNKSADDDEVETGDTSADVITRPEISQPQPTAKAVLAPEVAVAPLDNARWELPCSTLSDNCKNPVGTFSRSIQLSGDEGVEYLVKIRFRGIVEPMKYTDGTYSSIDSHFYQGGVPNDRYFNIMRLTTDKPAATYYINAESQVSSKVFMIDYTVDIPVAAKSLVTLFADIQNGDSVPNRDRLTVPGVSTGTAYMYGQFVQMNVVSVTLKK